MAASTRLTAEQRAERARLAGKTAQSPEVLAAKLVRDWPAFTPDQQNTVRMLLGPLVRRPSRGRVA